MSTNYVAFDSRSGRIVSVHLVAEDVARASARAQRYSRIGTEHIKVIAVPADAVERGQRYKVDVERGELVAAPEDDGVSFSYGSTVRFGGSESSE
jgi:hypothetical protein